MWRLLRDGFIAVVVDATVRIFFPSLLPLLPFAWMAVLVWLTIDLLKSKFLRKRIRRLALQLSGWSPVSTFFTVFVLGGAVACLYWWGVTRALSAAETFTNPTATPVPSASSAREKKAETSKNTHAESGKMKSVHDLFMTESKYLTVGGDTAFEVANSETKESVTISISIKLHLDFLTNSKFLSVYVPSSPKSFEFCRGLPDVYESLMSQAVRPSEEFILKGPSEMPVSSKGLVFTGQLLIYHEDEYSLRQLAELEEAFKRRNLFPQFRGLEYATTRWLQEEAIKPRSN